MESTSTRRQVERLCRKFGCTLSAHPGSGSPDRVAIDLPPGKVLASLGTHWIVKYRRDWNGGMGEVWPHLYGHIVEELKDGLSECNDGACDYCDDNHAT